MRRVPDKRVSLARSRSGGVCSSQTARRLRAGRWARDERLGLQDWTGLIRRRRRGPVPGERHSGPVGARPGARFLAVMGLRRSVRLPQPWSESTAAGMA